MGRQSQDFLVRKVERLRRAVDRCPKSAILFQGLGRTYLQLGLVEEGRRFLVRSLELDSSDPWTNLYLGTTHYQEGDYQAALNYFQTAHLLDRAIGMPLVGLGDCFQKLGMRERAKFYYDQATYLDPECVPSYTRLRKWSDLDEGV